MSDWEPELYHRFRRYRSEPVQMIFERLKLGPCENIADLGCGTGEHTVELARRSPGGFAAGIDSSPAMIGSALKLHARLDEDLLRRISFTQRDIREFRAPDAYTVIFSNAALQWISDQRPVFVACFEALKPGGRMVVQMPANTHETAQVALRKLSAEPHWRDAVGIDLEETLTVSEPRDYHAMLTGLGFAQVDCYYHVFQHPMESPEAVIEWSRATVLRRVLERLPTERHQEFLDELKGRLIEAYGTDGPLIFPFRRIFLWATRPK
jgi:trans-aconitate 2-methyltransferase